MNFKNSKTPAELAAAVHALCYCAEIQEAALYSNIGRLAGALGAVNSPAAVAICAIVNKALANAVADTTPRSRLVQLAELSAWLGAVKVGWL